MAFRSHIIFLYVMIFISCANTGDRYKRLDDELKLKDHYTRRKTEDLRQFTEHLDREKNNMSLKERYSEYRKLCDDYATFSFDSSLKYTILLNDIAREIGEPSYLADARSRNSHIMAMGGAYKEALDSLASTDLSDPTIPDSVKVEFYTASGRVYHNFGDYMRSFASSLAETYFDLGNEQLEKAIALAKDSVTIYWLEGKMALVKGDLAKARQKYGYAIDHFKMSSNRQSLLLSTLAGIEVKTGDYDQAIDHYIQAAIGDIRNAKTESVSLRGLAATLFYNEDEVNKALEYMNIALKDAQFYNSRHRLMVIEGILPIIINEKLNYTETKRDQLRHYLFIIAILAVALIVAFIWAIMQKQQVQRSKNILQDFNDRLTDANRIKDEYIGYYMNFNLRIVDQIDRFVQLARNQLAQKQYGNLNKHISSLSAKYDKKSVYRDFDRTFLQIFPTFVDDFNALLKDEDKMIVPDNSLNSTLRIFALIRMGVTSSEEIAKILDYSLNTIYNYRTRIKNKSIVGSGEFEDRIRKIGL